MGEAQRRLLGVVTEEMLQRRQTIRCSVVCVGAVQPQECGIALGKFVIQSHPKVITRCSGTAGVSQIIGVGIWNIQVWQRVELLKNQQRGWVETIGRNYVTRERSATAGGRRWVINQVGDTRKISRPHVSGYGLGYGGLRYRS